MKKPMPKIGMRNIKTACAVALCALVYFLLNRNPTFACIGAIFGMGKDFQSSKQHGGNRLFGTLIGGILGVLLFCLYLLIFPNGEKTLLLVVFVFVGIVVLIMLCQIFWQGGVQPGGVMMCILLFNTPSENYINYALNRIFDTAIGVIVAIIINGIFPGGFTFHRIKRLWMRWISKKKEEIVDHHDHEANHQ